MLAKQPLLLLLDDDPALVFVLFQRFLLVALLGPRHLEHLTTHFDQTLCLALVLLNLQPALVVIELFDPVILGKFRHELLPQLGLILARPTHFLLLGLHLDEVGIPHLLSVFQLLSHPHLLHPASLCLTLFKVQIVPQELELLCRLVLCLHLAQHRIQDSDLFLLFLLPLLFQPFLPRPFVPGELLDALVLSPLFGFSFLLLGFLVQHELLQHDPGLHLLVGTDLGFLGVFFGDLLDQLLHLLALLDVLLHGLLTLRLFHGYLLLVDHLDPFSLLLLLNDQLVLQLLLF
mmetsp:Transcript_97505/g.232115  ORF Transcript_97505/g.232115 Transcript_97505/m.232115 type:complete len:289 (-) Transcript_97505:515-1381(-)